MAHLQSKMCSIASSFQSSGMLIGDEEAASHWALSRLLGVLTCPALMPTCTHLSQDLLGRSHCAPRLPHSSDRRSPAVGS